MISYPDPISNPVPPIVPIDGAANLSDPALQHRKHPHEVLPLQPQIVLKGATRSSISTPKSKQVGKSGRFTDPNNRQYLAVSSPARKPGQFRLRRSDPPFSEDDAYIEVDDATLATLSGSRSSSRRKPPHARFLLSAESSTATSPWIPLNKSKAATASQFGSYGVVSSDSEGLTSVTDIPRAPVSMLLTHSDSGNLLRVMCCRDQWIPGYQDRVTRSSVQVAP